MKARHEYKHSLNMMDYTILRNRIKTILPHDQNAVTGEYTVKSLYFDTPMDKALREKIDGVDRREKFRIRRYDDNYDLIRLEKKSKMHGLCYKSSVTITKEETQKIINGDLKWMLTDYRKLVQELYSKMCGQLLKPKTLVIYKREPFVFPAGNVRITFDREISAGLNSTEFLSNKTPTVPVGEEIVLLEVKYDEFIPEHILLMLQVENRFAAACSKYALSRIYG